MDRTEFTDAPRPLLLETIVLGPNTRPLNAAVAKAIAQSMAVIGQQAPVVVRRLPDSDGGKPQFELIAGRHRCEAARIIGQKSLFGVVVAADDTDAALISISENLHRADLTRLERAEYEARWLATLAGQRGMGAAAHPHQPHDVGVSAAARTLNVSRKRVRRSRTIAALPAEVKAEAVRNGLANHEAALFEIAKEPTAEAQLAKTRVLGQVVPHGQRSRRRSGFVLRPGPVDGFLILRMHWDAATALKTEWTTASAQARRRFAVEVLRLELDPGTGDCSRGRRSVD